MAPIAEKFVSFGWSASNINGHNFNDLAETLATDAIVPDQPRCIVANTSKGQGISFMKDRVEWHHKVPNREQYEQARSELTQSAA